MPELDSAERRRRDEAVRTVRAFVPLYAALSLALFAPPVLRGLGLLALPTRSQSMWSAGVLILLVLAAAWIINRMAGLGQYRVGAGLKFELGAAVVRAEYVPVGTQGEPVGAVRSPLAVLRADVTEIQPALATRGDPMLGEAVLAALSEAETVARLLELAEPGTDEIRLGAARAAIGRFTDHVLGLRNEVLKGTFAAGEHLARVEADLVDLRAAADGLRRRP